MAVVSVLCLVTNLGYDAILPKYIADAGELTARQAVASKYFSLRGLLVLLSLPIIGITWIAASVFAPSQASFAQGWVWLAACFVFVGAMLNPQSVSQGLDRLRQFGNAQVASSLLTAMLFIVVMWLYPMPQTFLGVQAIGSIVLGALTLFGGDAPIRLVPHIRLLADLPDYVRRAWPMILNVFLGFGLYTSDGVFLPMFGSHYEIGLYASAVTLCNAANAFIALIPAAFFPRMIAWSKESVSKMLGRALVMSTAILAAIPVIYISARLGAEWVLPWLLGARFSGAAGPFAALICCFCVGVSYSTALSALILLSRQKTTLLMNGIGTALGLVAYPLLAFHGASSVSHGKLAIVTTICLVTLVILLTAWRRQRLLNISAGI